MPGLNGHSNGHDILPVGGAPRPTVVTAGGDGPHINGASTTHPSSQHSAIPNGSSYSLRQSLSNSAGPNPRSAQPRSIRNSARPVTSTSPPPSTSRVRSMSAANRRATLQLDFLIIGGGIAGLACAYELSRYGHRVHVLEKSSGLGQRAGGIRVPPNLTKILNEWGLQDELAKLTTQVRASTFRCMETGETIGRLEWKEDVIQETGADFLLMAYDDLHRMLYKLATSAGATVTFDTSVTTVSTDESDIPHALLANGEVLNADVIIGADGSNSAVRDAVTDQENEGRPSGMSVFTAVIPIDAMKGDPELVQLATSPEWPMWMGDNCSVLGYPIRQGKEYSVHAFWPDELSGPGDIDEGWDVVWGTDAVTVSSCESRIYRMLAHIPTALRTRYIERDLVEEWVDETGRVVLMGEAAHPLLPCGMHGPSLAVEDAVVFGVLFSRLRSYDQIPILTEAYQDLRFARCKNVHESELSNARLVWLPPGADREARNAYMKMSMKSGKEHWDDSELREQWEEIAGVFGYSARDAAEDWWVNWGSLRERSQAMNPLDYKFETVMEVVTTPTEPNGHVVEA